MAVHHPGCKVDGPSSPAQEEDVMRIRLNEDWSTFRTGEIVETSYTLGANLVFAGRASEVGVEVASVDAPQKDKMIRRVRARRKSNAGERDEDERQDVG